MTTIETKLIEATRNDALGWEIVRAVDLAPECMARFGEYDWQAHVPPEIRDLWRDLPLSARLAVFVMARQAAYFDDPSVD